MLLTVSDMDFGKGMDMVAAMQYRIEISTNREGIARFHLPGRSLELEARADDGGWQVAVVDPQHPVQSAAANTIAPNIVANGSLTIASNTTIQGLTSGSGATLTNLVTVDGGGAGVANNATIFAATGTGMRWRCTSQNDRR